MRTEKEVRQKLDYLKDNLLDLISDDRSLNNVGLVKLKLIVNTLKWVLKEKELILDTKGGKKI
jgi:hypothetical protein